MTIKVVPLGAGQDVGRSCILLTIGTKNVMLDCGMHMGYNDHRRYPDFNYISKSGDFDSMVDCIIISHFHLDHCGALPYFTEMCGYNGPIYMTHPTRAIAPILLEDMRKVCVERKQEKDFFTASDIKNCMMKVVAVDLHEVIKVDDNLEIKAYYAGHVLGAAMFHIKYTNAIGVSESVVYTGDYNMTPDRHLGSAWIDECEPDLLITESTYATTIRDSKRARERDFLKKVHDAVSNGGKVLVPVFALGRAQELLILLESYWDRMSDLHNIPIYFSAGLTEKANDYYKLFISWTNENIKKSFVEHNMFDFSRIKTWKQEYAGEPGPMVLFASPGMLHAGTSLTVFTKWCHDPNNMIIMPGYCVAGTVGAKVLAGEKKIDIDRFKSVVVNLQVKNLSFSAHADAKGIMALVQMSKTKNVMLVHGEKLKMAQLKARIVNELGVPCFDPANGESITIQTENYVPGYISNNFLNSHTPDENGKMKIKGMLVHSVEGKNRQCLTLVDLKHSNLENTVQRHHLKKPFDSTFLFSDSTKSLKERLESVLERAHKELAKTYKDCNLSNSEIEIGGDIKVAVKSDCSFDISLSNIADPKAANILTILNRLDFKSIA
ncbi:Integrator complex subunit 11 [Boothiomyces macroporosus]|uniref:Integrator complex subunit 11 n=1 Tax=Boothiomyces macroporosus TaxID=261099 RepID=A0AAD5UHJ2_9FUNG|nr:Integrator complex subunit 11 [Boothiomyces macroporosus]